MAHHMVAPGAILAPPSALVVRPTKRRGRGLFAAEPLAAGTILERAPVLLLSGADHGAVSRTLVGDYLFRWGDDNRQVCVAFGMVSMANHDEAPNAEVRALADAFLLELVALCPIRAGEEITIRYRRGLWFDPETG